MAQRSTQELISILRNTLRAVQESIWNDSLSVRELKRFTLRTIAELEVDLKESDQRSDVRAVARPRPFSRSRHASQGRVG